MAQTGTKNTVSVIEDATSRRLTTADQRGDRARVEGVTAARLISELYEAARQTRCYLIATTYDASTSEESRREASDRLATLNAALDSHDLYIKNAGSEGSEMNMCWCRSSLFTSETMPAMDVLFIIAVAAALVSPLAIVDLLKR